MRSSTALLALTLSGVVGAAVLTAAPASAEESYPSWADIRQAKTSEAAKSSEADRLEGLLTQLREDAGSLGDAAVEADGRYNTAKEKLEATDEELGALAVRRNEAADRSAELMRQVASLAAQTYKTGGTASDSAALVLLDAEASADALHSADLMDKVSSRAGNLYAEATAAERIVAGIKDQEQQVRNAQAELAAAAEQALHQAGESSAAAEKAVQDEEARKSVLLAQLADLRGSTAEAEEARIRGIAAEEAFKEQRAAAERTANEARQKPTVPGPSNPPAAAPEAPVGQQPGQPEVPVAAPQPAQPAPRPALPVPQPAPRPAPPAPQPAPPAPRPQPVDDPAGAQNYAAGRMAAYGWNESEFRCLVILWNHESGWRTSADNPYSDAYGIPQSLPGSKMGSHGADWQTNYRTQINWGLDYIKGQYRTPCGAYAAWQRNNWY